MVKQPVACNRCGSCCRQPVFIQPEEVMPLGTYDEYTIIDHAGNETPIRVMRRGMFGICIAWSAQAGCTIYEGRPKACREMTPGSSECSITNKCRCCGKCCFCPVPLDASEGTLLIPAQYRGKDYMRRRDDGSCMALGPDRRCAIYDVRPVACRIVRANLDPRCRWYTRKGK